MVVSKGIFLFMDLEELFRKAKNDSVYKRDRSYFDHLLREANELMINLSSFELNFVDLSVFNRGTKQAILHLNIEISKKKKINILRDYTGYAAFNPYLFCGVKVDKPELFFDNVKYPTAEKNIVVQQEKLKKLKWRVDDSAINLSFKDFRKQAKVFKKKRARGRTGQALVKYPDKINKYIEDGKTFYHIETIEKEENFTPSLTDADYYDGYIMIENRETGKKSYFGVW